MRYYLSHSIRGKYGKDATPSQMKENCDRVMGIAAAIRKYIPAAELYVPAEHEDFVHIAFADGYLTEHQLLEIDCKIIDKCDGVIVFAPADDPMCGGRSIEYEHAVATGKPVLIFGASWEAISWLAHQVVRS
jgi:nucleoside 2-deoxyribosyltransferase